MLLPAFEYHRPTSLEEAFEALDAYGDKAKILAGGTDLLVNMKRKVVWPDHVLDIQDVPRLAELDAQNGRIRIGSGVTAASLAADETVRARLGPLSAAAGKLGSPQVRTRATIGGNLCTARPAGDLPLPLLVLEAVLVAKSSAGQREIPIEKFFVGPGKTVIRPGEILTELVVDQPPAGSGGGFIKLGLRRAMEIALVNVAALITLDSDGKTIHTARLAMGSVAPTPIRSARAEAVLTGAKATEENLSQAAQAAAQDARPITDHRASAEYKLEIVRVLTRRVLQRALEDARKA